MGPSEDSSGGHIQNDVGPNTMDDLMGVIAWRLRYLAAGVWPSSRHDGSALDGKRLKKKGSLGIRGALVEVNGDWLFSLMCSNFLATIPRLVVAGVATRLLLRFSTDTGYSFTGVPLQQTETTMAANTS